MRFAYFMAYFAQPSRKKRFMTLIRVFGLMARNPEDETLKLILQRLLQACGRKLEKLGPDDLIREVREYTLRLKWDRARAKQISEFGAKILSEFREFRERGKPASKLINDSKLQKKLESEKIRSEISEIRNDQAFLSEDELKELKKKNANAIANRTVFAVNCGGKEHVDVYGVRYSEDFKKVGLIRNHGEITINNVPPEDMVLYQVEML
jgi:hypothetical protein